jgi:hypothetical protein
MSFIGKLRSAQAALVDDRDPWKAVLERAVPPNVTCMSSVALTDLLGVPPTTGNCRRLALTMRSLGWVALKSRRLMPGGWRTTTCRGWARPLRETKSSPTMKNTGASGLNPEGMIL